LFFDIQNGFV